MADDRVLDDMLAECGYPDLEVGRVYVVWALQHNWVGRYVGARGAFLLFEEVSFLGDVGRVADSFRLGLEASTHSEVEPVPGLLRIHRAFAGAVAEYPFDPPEHQK